MIEFLKIGDFAEVITGGTPSTLNKEYWEGGDIPWLNSGELNQDIVNSSRNFITKEGLRNSAARLMPPDSVLIALTGATTGKIGYLTFEACANQSVTGILPSERHFPKFLYFYLNSIRKKVLNDAYGGAQPHISQGYVKNLKISLPPLENQKKIAAILDKADELRRNDKKILEKFDRLAQSIFLEMFGDPVMNEKGWEKLSLGEIASEIKYGTNAKSFDNYQEGSIPVIRIPNINFGYVNFRDLKYSTLPKKELENVSLKKGDLLFVRSNGNPDYIGRCAMYNSDFDAVFASYLIRVKVNRNISIRPDFIAYHINYKSFRRRVIREARTTAGNYNLNTAGLRSFELITPPIELQNRFATIIEKIENQKELCQQSLQKSEELFQSMLQRAFRGELV
jgi:type I restriction enzyme, S subunit